MFELILELFRCFDNKKVAVQMTTTLPNRFVHQLNQRSLNTD